MSKYTGVARTISMIALLAVLISGCGAAATPAAQPAPTQPVAAPTTAPEPTAAPTAAPVATEVAAPTAAPAPAPTAAPEPAADKNGGTITVSYSKDLTSLDPPKALSTMDWGTVAQLLYNGLYIFDKDDQLAPDLAAAMPEISEDGLTYTIKLKPGVKFHNGRELVAEDVKYSIERNAKPDAGSWNATSPMSNIVGGKDLLDGKAETAAGIVVVDDHTIQFKLVNPDAYLVHSLTLTTNFIVPKEAVEEWGEDFSFHPVGTGPYVLKEWTAGQKLVFERNPEYFVSGVPYVESIVYELGAAPEVALLRFERGEIDVLGDGVPSGDIERIATDPTLSKQFLNTKTYLMYFMGFNNEVEPFNDPKVRQAVGMAINRERLLQLSANTGVIAYDWYPPAQFTCSVERDALYPYDPEKAKALLAEAGYADGLEVDVWFRVSRPWLARVPEAMQQDLAAIGVKVNLLQLESAPGTEMIKSGELKMYATTWGASFPDPYNYATEIFASDSTYGQRLRYSNPDVDELVSLAKQNTDPEARCKQWLDIQDLVMTDSPAVPLFIAGHPDLQSLRLEDFVYNATYHRPYYEQVWIAPENR